MALRFAVLALLAEQPLHGYAIHAELETRMVELLEPAYGDVYRALAALQRRGLVAVSDQRVGRRPRRKVYAITPAGLAELRAWLVAPPAQRRDDLLLRVLLAEHCAPELVTRVVAVHGEHARRALAELSAQRSAEGGADGLPALLRALRLEGTIHRERARLTAIELVEATLARYRRGTPAGTLVRELAARPDGGRAPGRPTG